MLAFFWSHWPNTHAFVRLRMHARHPVTRLPLARFRVIVAPRYYSIVVAPVLLLCYLRSRVDMALITLHFDCFFFFFSVAHVPHTSTHRLSIGDEMFRRFRDRMCRSCTHTHASTHAPGGFSHDIAIFFYSSVRSRFRRATAYSRFSSFDKWVMSAPRQFSLEKWLLPAIRRGNGKVTAVG